MTSKLMMFLGFGYIVGTIASIYIEGGSIGSAEQSDMNSLMVFTTVRVFGAWTVPSLNLDFFTEGLPKLLLWDYSFLNGGWAIIKWILLYPLSIGAVWGVYQTALGIVSLTRR